MHPTTPTPGAERFLGTLRRNVQAPRGLGRSLLRGVMAGILLCAAHTGFRIAAGDNLHEVRAGAVFRSGQMSADHLRRAVAAKHIRTVVNLRGSCPDFNWYQDESRCTHEMNASQEDVCLSAIRLPSPTELRRLIEVLDRAERPILLHCRQGVDRTGLASMAAKLLEPGVSLRRAKRQLGLGFGYVPLNGTETMLKFVDLYEEWLRRVACAHSSELFRHWALCEYCPGACRGWVELADDAPKDACFSAQRAHTLHVRAHNTSVREWRLRPGTLQGLHARYQVCGDDGAPRFQEQAGLFDAVVPPGQSLELLIGIPALPPGHYALDLDLIDAEQNAFCQFGQEPFVWEFRVGP
jgi:hypothetical protein